MKMMLRRRLIPGIALGFVLLAGYRTMRTSVPVRMAAKNQRKPAPDFALGDSAGATVRLSDYRGKVVLLDFWETSCGPCRIEIPWFTEFERTYQRRGLSVIGAAIDEAGWNSVKPFMVEKRINYRMTLASDQIARDYGGLDLIPTVLLIDRSGHIAATHVGLIPRKDFEAEIQTVLAE